MELSSSCLEGLQLAGSSIVSDEVFSRLSVLAVECLLGTCESRAIQDDPKLAKIDQMVAKESFSALMTVLAEATRTDSDTAILGSALEDCKFAPDRIQAFQTIYTENKPSLQATLGRIRSTLPHVVDVDWRLDYYIKNNQLEKVDKPLYLINFQTQGSPLSDKVQFACTQEQLQDLVGKLKDASKAMENFSQ